MWVSPFGDLRVFGYVLLTVAFRSLSRPSSAPSARASTLRSFCLTALTFPSSVRASGFSMVLSIFLHNILMLLRCLPIQRFILSNKSFLFGIRFLWCLHLSPSDSTSFEGVAPSTSTKLLILKVLPGSHLLSRSLAPQYYRPAVSLPSCSGWERVFLTAASPPDNYFFDSYSFVFYVSSA